MYKHHDRCTEVLESDESIVFKPQQPTETIVSKQITFVNLIYDFETKLTGTIVSNN